jgi:16S rRNA (cytidine1402-2'-O)-methyltransferase
MSASKAAGRVAKLTGLERQTLYARAVELRGE